MRKLSTIMVFVAMVFMMSAVNANALTVGYDNTDQYTIREVDEYHTYDNEFFGMEVTLSWDIDNTPDTYIWGDLGNGKSGIEFTRNNGDYAGAISLDGDTWDATWDLDTDHRRITSITFDAFAGNAAFDTKAMSVLDTVGSRNGWEIEEIGDPDLSLDIEATYSGIIALNGDEAVGDLYRYLTIDFDPYFARNNSFSFRADMDNVVPTPEPSTILLLGFGLLGLVGFKRRKTNR